MERKIVACKSLNVFEDKFRKALDQFIYNLKVNRGYAEKDLAEAKYMDSLLNEYKTVVSNIISAAFDNVIDEVAQQNVAIECVNGYIDHLQARSGFDFLDELKLFCDERFIQDNIFVKRVLVKILNKMRAIDFDKRLYLSPKEKLADVLGFIGRFIVYDAVADVLFDMRQEAPYLTDILKKVPLADLFRYISWGLEFGREGAFESRMLMKDCGNRDLSEMIRCLDLGVFDRELFRATVFSSSQEVWTVEDVGLSLRDKLARDTKNLTTALHDKFAEMPQEAKDLLAKNDSRLLSVVTEIFSDESSLGDLVEKYVRLFGFGVINYEGDSNCGSDINCSIYSEESLISFVENLNWRNISLKSEQISQLLMMLWCMKHPEKWKEAYQNVAYIVPTHKQINNCFWVRSTAYALRDMYDIAKAHGLVFSDMPIIVLDQSSEGQWRDNADYLANVQGISEIPILHFSRDDILLLASKMGIAEQIDVNGQGAFGFYGARNAVNLVGPVIRRIYGKFNGSISIDEICAQSPEVLMAELRNIGTKDSVLVYEADDDMVDHISAVLPLFATTMYSVDMELVCKAPMFGRDTNSQVKYQYYLNWGRNASGGCLWRPAISYPPLAGSISVPKHLPPISCAGEDTWLANKHHQRRHLGPVCIHYAGLRSVVSDKYPTHSIVGRSLNIGVFVRCLMEDVTSELLRNIWDETGGVIFKWFWRDKAHWSASREPRIPEFELLREELTCAKSESREYMQDCFWRYLDLFIQGKLGWTKPTLFQLNAAVLSRDERYIAKEERSELTSSEIKELQSLQIELKFIKSVIHHTFLIMREIIDAVKVYKERERVEYSDLNILGVVNKIVAEYESSPAYIEDFGERCMNELPILAEMITLCRQVGGAAFCIALKTKAS